jgi:hypothetical protein
MPDSAVVCRTPDFRGAFITLIQPNCSIIPNKNKLMLNAAPGESLDLSLVREEKQADEAEGTTCEPLTRRQEKKRSEQLSELKSKLRQILKDRKKKPKFKLTQTQRR